MFIVALLMYMLLALGDAHVYNSCELAEELANLGVAEEHLATWVCIAFHESRFDTAARNPHSGDHGLFQISEVYWCGPGKACGLQCSALRDEDISNDVKCAQHIYTEHTRLQGDGFLAWVVYPHHCRHNAKKFLADCDRKLKNGTETIKEISRSLRNRYRNFTSKQNVDTDYYDTNKSKPRYLAINSLLEGRFGKSFEDNYNKKYDKIDWVNYKYDNVDSLKLPMPKKDGQIQFIETHTTTPRSRRPTTATPVKLTTTTIDPTLIGIKPPMPRRIESNQFRRKMNIANKNVIKSVVNTVENSSSENILSSRSSVSTTVTLQNVFQTTNKPNADVSVISSNTNSLPTLDPFTSKTSFNYQNIQTAHTITPLAASSTAAPIQISNRQNKILYHPEPTKFVSSVSDNLNTKTSQGEHTTVKSTNGILFNFPALNSKKSYTTDRPNFIFNSYTFRAPVINTKNVEELTTPKHFSRLNNQKSLTTNFNNNISTENKKILSIEQKPIFNAFINKHHYNINNNSLLNSLMGQLSNIINKSGNESNINNTNLTEYSSNSLDSANASNINKDYSTLPNETETKSTAKTWSNIYPYTNKSQNSNYSWKSSPLIFKSNNQSTASPGFRTTIQSNNIFSSALNSTLHDSYMTSSTTTAPATKRTTSIFDLYLRPQKLTLPPFQFRSFNSSLKRVQIFSGGTTALPYQLSPANS